MNNLPQRILLTGTFEVGKTTLLRRLSEDPSILSVQEVARDLLVTDSQLELDPCFQDMVFEEQIHRERQALNQAKEFGKRIIVYDRGILDIVAFSTVFGYEIKSAWTDNLRSRYDAVGICSKNDVPLNPENHSINVDLEEYRNNLDITIRSLVNQYSFPSFEVSGTVDERISIFQEFVNYTLFNKENRRSDTERR